MTAGNRGLANLTVIVDRNRLQQGAGTEETNGLDPLDADSARVHLDGKLMVVAGVEGEVLCQARHQLGQLLVVGRRDVLDGTVGKTGSANTAGIDLAKLTFEDALAGGQQVQRQSRIRWVFRGMQLRRTRCSTSNRV